LLSLLSLFARADNREERTKSDNRFPPGKRFFFGPDGIPTCESTGGSMDRKIAIFDTTLRDGMQGIEINYTLEDKLEIAAKLDELGIDYIEGGFPLSNDKEAEFFRRVRDMSFSHAKVASFGSTRKAGGQAHSDGHIRALLDAETPVVVVVGKTWTEHVTKVIGTDLEENLRMISDSISFLKKEGREVVFDMEHFFDGYKANREYARRYWMPANPPVPMFWCSAIPTAAPCPMRFRISTGISLNRAMRTWEATFTMTAVPPWQTA
jgi:hypothetical protein